MELKEEIIKKQIPENYDLLKEKGLAKLLTLKCFGAPSILICIDEGCTARSFNNNGKIYTVNLAGSGILLGVNKTVELFRQNAELQKLIKTLTWHEGCGAASKARQKEPSITAEGFVLRLAEKLKSELEMDCRVVKIAGKEPKDNEGMLTRPPEYHNAMCVYINQSGKAFNYKKNDKLPPGFTIDSGFFGEKIAKEELKVALDIAFGNHGMNKLITAENPFIVNYIQTGGKKEEPQWITDAITESGIDRKRIRTDYIKSLL